MVVALNQLQRGDHIYTESRGGSFYHHGIYVGEAKVNNPNPGKDVKLEHAVIHFVGYDGYGIKRKTKSECKACFYRNQDGVELTCMDCFTEGNNLYRYEYQVSYVCYKFKARGSCSRLQCSQPDKVIKRAYIYLGNKKFDEYNSVVNNCEHFATWCKTGTSICNQIVGCYCL